MGGAETAPGSGASCACLCHPGPRAISPPNLGQPPRGVKPKFRHPPCPPCPTSVPFAQRLERLDAQMASPDFFSAMPAGPPRLSREHQMLSRLMELHGGVCLPRPLEKDLGENRDLARDESGDAELRALAQSEIPKSKSAWSSSTGNHSRAHGAARSKRFAPTPSWKSARAPGAMKPRFSRGDLSAHVYPLRRGARAGAWNA